MRYLLAEAWIPRIGGCTARIVLWKMMIKDSGHAVFVPSVADELIRAAEERANTKQNIPMQLLLLLGRLGTQLDFAQESRWLKVLLRKIMIWLQQASPVETQMFQQEVKHYNLSNVHQAPVLDELLACVFEHGIEIHTSLSLLDREPTTGAGFRAIAQTPAVGFTSFANSPLWRQQQDFYRSKSVKAWTDNHVPWQISNNGLVTAQYVRKIEAAVSKLGTPANSMSIVELGAGHGQLSVALAELLPEKLTNMRIKAIATDFHDDVFKQQIQLPWVRSLCEKELLDFCVATAQPWDWTRAERAASELPTSSSCLISGRPLEEELHADLVVIVGNYAYDSFPVDLLVQTTSNLPYLLCSTDATMGDENLLAVPWQNFKDAGASPELHSLVEFAASRGRGFHVIPSAALSAFSLILDSLLPTTRGLMMIAGDCPIFHDDGRWGGRGTIAQLEAIPSGSVLESVTCSFDIPRISPEKQCAAIPVDLHLLAQGFANCATANGFHANTSTISPCILSAFAVVDVLCTRPQPGVTDHPLSIPVTTALQFGPNELQVLRDAITDEGYARHCISLKSIYEIWCVCNFDTIFFLEVRFLVMSLLQQLEDSASSDHTHSCRTCWGLAAVKAFAHQHAVDEHSFQQSRQALLQWLQAIHLPELAVFFMAPTTTTIDLHNPGSNSTCLPSLQLMDTEIQKLSHWAVVPLSAWECFHLIDACDKTAQAVPPELQDQLGALLSDSTNKVPGLKRLKRKYRVMMSEK